MSVAKRLLSTSGRRLLAPARQQQQQQSAQVGSDDLPPVIYRYVKRHLARNPSSSSSSIPNPFVSHRRAHQSSPSALDEATSSNTHIPAYISRRRQKQLLAHYGDFALPPSPLNAAALAAELRWEDGSVVSWAGDAEAKDTNSLYGGRKRMFKGHKHEREKPDKMRDTAERMKGMGKRVEDWKKTKAEANASAKPPLPF